MNGTVYVPAGRFRVNALVSVKLKSHMTFRMDAGATLVAIPNAAEWHSVLVVPAATDVRIIGGRILGERAQHTGTTGEWGFGVDIRSGTHIVVEDVTANDFWGDGFYVGQKSGAGMSQDITFRRCRADNNRRQGISIVACDGALVESGDFTNTSGTPPAAGIDLEPNPGQVVRNVRIAGNHFAANEHGVLVTGIVTGGGGNEDNVVENNVIESSRQYGVGVMHEASSLTIRENRLVGNKWGIALRNTTGNTVEMNSCENSGRNGIMLRDCAATTLEGNRIVESSRLTDVHSDQILVTEGSSNNSFDTNTARVQSFPTYIRYGIRIDAGCSGNRLTGNDLRQAGGTASLSNAGTGTVIGTGNQLDP